MKNVKVITPINTSKVYLDTVRLFSHILLMSRNLSRIDRQLIGEHMTAQIVNMVSNVSSASITRDNEKRLLLLDDFMSSLNVLSALITGLSEIKQISPKHEAIYTDMTEEIGKQINSWRSKTASKLK